MSRRGWILFASMCVIWGLPYLFIRVAVRELDPGSLVFLRTATGGLLLLPLAIRSGRLREALVRWRPIAAFAAIEMALPWLLLNDAERHLTSSLSGLLIAGVPLVGMVIAHVSGAERVARLQVAGLGFGILGVLLLVGLDLHGLNAGSLLEMAVVVVAYAVAPVIMARRLADLPPIPVVTVSLLMVAIAYTPWSATHLRAVDAQAAASVAVLALVCTALAFVLFFTLIIEIGPARATIITYVNPAVAILLGVLLLHEPLTLGMILGFPLILAGSVLAARRRSLPAATTPEAAVCETVSTDAAEAPESVDPDGPMSGLERGGPQSGPVVTGG